MSKVLIVHQNIPESTDCYIVDASDEELELLKLCNGHYINGGSDEINENALQPINLFLYSGNKKDCLDWAEEYCVATEDIGKWHKNKLEIFDLIKSEDFSFICITGWIL